MFAAKQVIIIPSISWGGSLSSKILSLKVPGSDSSAFITKYLSSSSAKKPHLTPEYLAYAKNFENLGNLHVLILDYQI